ncbi:MAG: Ig-like domain repeat protein [Bifidobacteriaceae bacterium]|jgi:PKD repeat protein/flagellar hook assembly protein FlgD|nr:Ig-like domain repeat protein [Bifidobacteriaceae bacterium]
MRALRVLPALVAAAVLGIGTIADAADPPVTVVFTTTTSPQVVLPELTGTAASVTYRVTLNRAANVTLTIVDGEDAAIRTLLVEQSRPQGTTTGTWDFTDGSGMPVPTGLYTFRARAVDSEDNTAEATWATGIDRHARLPILGVEEGEQLSETLDVALANPTDLTISNVQFFIGRTVAATAANSCVPSVTVASPGEDGYFRATLSDVERCGQGTRYVRAGFQLTDALGYTHSLPSGATPVPVWVTDETPPTVSFNTLRTMYLASPAAYESLQIQAIYGTTEYSGVKSGLYEIADAQGTVVASGAMNTSSGNYYVLPWTGLAAGSTLLPGGTYTFTASITDNADNTGTASVPITLNGTVPGHLVSVEPDEEEPSLFHATVSVDPALTVKSVLVCRSGTSSCLTAQSGAEPGTYDVDLDYSTSAQGAYQANARITWAPGDGTDRQYTAAPVAVSVVDVASPIVSFGALKTMYLTGPAAYESQRIQANFTEPSGVKSGLYEVTDAQGTVVSSGTMSRTGTTSGNYSITWTGRDSTSALLPGGTYTFTATITDNPGNTDVSSTTITLNDTVPGQFVSLEPDGQVATLFHATVSVNAALNPTIVTVCRNNASSCVTAQPGSGPGTYEVDLDYSTMAAREYQVPAQIKWNPDGTVRTYTTAPVPVPVSVADVTPPVVSFGTSRTMYLTGPAAYESREIGATCIDVSGVKSGLYEITNAQGTVVLSGAMNRALASYYYADWSGLDSESTLLPAGSYTFTATITDNADNTTTASTTITLDRTVPGQLTTPADGGTLQGTAAFVYGPNAGLPSTATIGRIDIRIGNDAPYTNVTIANPSPDGQWRTTFSVGALAAGAHQLVTTTTWTPPDGTPRTYTAETWDVEVEHAVIPLTLETSPASGAVPLEASVTITASHPTGRLLSLAVDWGDGTVEESTLAAPYGPPTVTHTFTQVGSQTITVTATDGEGGFGSATSTVEVRPATNEPPTLNLSVAPEATTVGTDVTVDVEATDPEGGPLTYSVWFGDETSTAPALTGTYTEPLARTHAYASPGSYLVRAQITDGVHTAARNVRVTVVPPGLVTANAGEDQAATVGRPVILDGTLSTPAATIDSYAWSFGDGGTGTGATLTHTYTAPGVYTAILTVRSGSLTRTDTATVSVNAAPATSGLRIAVTDADTAAPVPGAQARVITPDGLRHSSVTGSDGRATLFGMPDGALAVSVWAPGYLPDRVFATVADGAGEGSVALVRAAIGGAVIVPPRELSPGEIAERGINPGTEDVFEAGIRLDIVTENPDDDADQHFERASTSCQFTWWTSSYYYVCDGVTAGPGAPGGSGDPSASGVTLGVSHYIPSIDMIDGVPIVEWLVIPAHGSFLEEYVDVSLIVQNLGGQDSGAVFTGGTAYLDLPSGMSLAPVVTPGLAQSPRVAVDDVPAGVSRTVTWTVRGDAEGTYPLRADYAGVCEPSSAPIALVAQAPAPHTVWGGSALRLSVATDPSATRWMPYRVSTTLTNLTDPGTGPTIYNAYLGLGERPAGASATHAKYVYAPGATTVHSARALAPGESVTVSAIVYPGIGSDTDSIAGGTVPTDQVAQMRADLEETGAAHTSGVTIGVSQATATHQTSAPGAALAASIDWASRPGAGGEQASFLTLTWASAPAGQTVTGYSVYTRDSLVGGSWRKVPTSTLGPSARSVRLDPRDGTLGGYFTVATETADGIEAFHELIPGLARYVALGDSYSSGEGVGEYETGTGTDRAHMGDLTTTVNWTSAWTHLKSLVTGADTENTCHRSPRGSYSRILAADESFGPDLAPSDVASCSGAVSADVVSPDPVRTREGAQADHLSEFTQVVTLTLGGDDVGFADIVARCLVSEGNCAGYPGASGLFAMQRLVDQVDVERANRLGAIITSAISVLNCPATAGATRDTIACVEALKDLLGGAVELMSRDPDRVPQASLALRPEYTERLKRSYRAIAERAPHATVYVGDYPHLFDSVPWTGECSVSAIGGGSISRSEATAINGLADTLNAAAHDAIADINTELGRRQFTAVPVAAAFAGRELCAGGQLNPSTAFHPLTSPYGSWLDAYDAVSSSFHPNAEGQRLYAEAFAEAMASRTTQVVAIDGTVAGEPFAIGAGATSVTVAATVEGHTDYDLSFTGPGGTVYTAASAGTSGGITDGQRWLTVADPAPGQWHATLSPRWTASPGADSSTTVRLTITVDDAVRAPTASGTVTETSAGQWRFEAVGLRPGDTAAWTFQDGTQISGAVVTRSVPGDGVPSAILTITGADGQTASGDVLDPRRVPLREQPVVTGAAVQVPGGDVGTGTVLTASGPLLMAAPDSRGYQWYRDGEPIPGATGQAYAVTAEDRGHDLSVAVTAQRAGYADVVTTSPEVSVPAGPETPDPGDSGQTPDPGDSGQTPDPGGSGKTPDPGGSGQTPDPGGSGQTPSPSPGDLASPAPLEGTDQPGGSTGIGGNVPEANVALLRAAVTKVRVVKGKTVKVPVIVYPAADAHGTVKVTWNRTGKAVRVGGSAKTGGTVKGTLGKPLSLSIKAKALGTSKVRLTVGKRSLTITVVVVAKARSATKAKITGTRTLRQGSAAVLSASPRPAKATGAVPRWKSSKPSIATIDRTGRIVAKKPGTTVVRLTVGKATTRVKITVR